ncbi:hypothetical protein DWV78_16860 [Agathobacter rectalis]|uniref:Uncharacterized protein n=1 Tax=Agathobacter rectalis TaxID=39491 RepID=A0A413B2V7_9FIRM|nr:hypothetical protein DWV78_16860 [Agathobacter rectalis]
MEIKPQEGSQYWVCPIIVEYMNDRFDKKLLQYILDALEMEIKPQEGSQYWVCPIIVEYMNDRFDKKLLQYIQNNEGNGMQFMAEYYNQNKG